MMPDPICQRHRERGLPSDHGQPRSKRVYLHISPATKKPRYSTGEFVQQKNQQKPHEEKTSDPRLFRSRMSFHQKLFGDEV